VKRAAILIICALFWTGGATALAAPVNVVDGDSFNIGKQRFRLYGIDAPELHQDCRDASGKWWPCGKRARSELRRLIGNNPVHCTERTRDRFGRAVAVCNAGGRDLAEEMVRLGWATAYPDFASSYAGVESEARAARRGLWAGTFESPRAWRDGHPRAEDRTELHSAGTWLREKSVAVREAVSSWVRRVWHKDTTAR
jgi:endonuclease YncB( thermonuclease family)